ncbi:MAG: thioredoxin family protein [Bacteroidetes bacterium]|nr:thioredoxin family protein [Bacteroidota bacterium]
MAVIAVLIFAFIQKDNNEISEGNNDPANKSGIQFISSDWSKALAEAKKQHKLIFLDAYASWCGPCKLLKKKTFPDKSVGDFFNANYINIAIDMEKGEGPLLSEKFEVSAYPTLIIADADGNIVTYTRGYITPKQLIEFGEYGIKHKK